MAKVNSIPGLNLATFFAGIVMLCLVEGLMPRRAALSDTANVEVWNVLGFDPVNTAVWTDKSVTENPDNQYVQYFNTKPFDALLDVQDGIGLLTCYTDEKMPSINNIFCTETLNNIFESGMDVKEALDEAQSALQNEFGE